MILSDLIARLEGAEEGSMDLNEDIALATGYCSAWLSKHRYWNFNYKNESEHSAFSWPTQHIPEYESDTGKKITLGAEPWNGWGWDANLPDWTTSIDSAVTLIPEGFWYGLERWSDGCYAKVRQHSNDMDQWEGCQKPAALAICIAALKAIQHKEAG